VQQATVIVAHMNMQYVTCSQLKPGIDEIYIIIKVLETVVNSEFEEAKKAIALVGDSTGSIYFVATNEQVAVVQTGKVLELKNATIDMHNGEMRLIVDRWGSISETNEEILSVGSFNLSSIQYDLIELC